MPSLLRRLDLASRGLPALSAALLAFGLLAGPVAAQEGAAPGAAQGAAGEWRHGLSLLGTPKYPADFKHFDYVNPDAPKAGLLRLSVDGTFDSLNDIIPRGTPASGLQLIYDTLMSPAYDEVATEYGLLAESVRYPADFSTVTYRLRPEAKWHDGQPVTAEDVVWSFEQLTKNNPRQAYYYSHVKKAEVTGEREVTFTFDQAGNRELPQIVGQIRVMPKHWWTGKDASGKQRDISQGTLEVPLGSGPYKVKQVVPGRSISFERVPDYWGAGLPVNIGTNNFAEQRYEYFRDNVVELEAFKGDQYDFRVETSAKDWATAYDFPAVKQGKVILEEFPDRASGSMQAFIPNLRRTKFQDQRVRRALNYALDFDGMNRTLFFGQYKRTSSYFQNTELASSGLPTGLELEILNSVKDKVPPSVFTTPYANPPDGGEDVRRANLREAAKLLREAGYQVKGGKLVDPQGQPFTIEILLASPAFERVALFYKPTLERLGITVNIRQVDVSQYINRIRARDFDMIVTGWGQSLSPGNEQRDFWGSAAADREGSSNYAGIKDSGIDALIERVIYAKDRAELVAATHALDRVLLAHDYVVPTWNYPNTRTARWNRFGRPDKLPEYSFGFPDIWWWDAQKAAQTGGTQ
ncbi:extracellular solute-binding protein family 5 [Ancylobacter novellus DSM 506]|uniref:Extracellular solute-binding protein family 5 n=1 Tax=Ancylobacter novellus (strain ATCC 8093 / DSM 506 / JCM 20403 / CCM 1077 / IAM 12100 / NBRC 12443 / NCIMB 10456) TaxID=639283 RepID=D7A1X2_ANCN5|nr:extracellular solute-binding protein [Ancylobacter novellus]ADH87588.1 extracellular solute-binding protein family 5 [Ancylobacter novellus DSM 506]